ncbi:hypothetical protein H5410_060065 [Solanum commersonii]|uniref:Uncharacterized protein n=1 Tax=Solanum commersonii TaxID=4109 RepID=A0A9J5W429_SOLCO|nr:hypothetical protein H5410_060065 [Solanum commersonii]
MLVAWFAALKKNGERLTCRRWGKDELKKLLWWAVWSSFTEEFEDQLQEIKEVDDEAGKNLIDKYPPKVWCRAYLDKVFKNKVVDNNFTESFNAWIFEARYKPIIGMLKDIKVKIMEREKKRQPRRGLIDEDEASEEDINCTAPQPTQESQFEYVASSSYFSVVADDDEDPRLRPRTISEEAFLTRLRKRQNPQEPIESRVIGFRGDKYGVSEPTNLLIAPTNLTWNGKDAITTNQLQKLRPRRG